MSIENQSATAWTSILPDGAVSVESGENFVVLRASKHLQRRFEALLERKKSATLTPGETAEFDAICHLDEALSWLNRLARTP